MCPEHLHVRSQDQPISYRPNKNNLKVQAAGFGIWADTTLKPTYSLLPVRPEKEATEPTVSLVDRRLLNYAGLRGGRRYQFSLRKALSSPQRCHKHILLHPELQSGCMILLQGSANPDSSPSWGRVADCIHSSYPTQNFPKVSGCASQQFWMNPIPLSN